MKKIVSLLLCLAMVLCLAACSKTEEKAPETPENNEEQNKPTEQAPASDFKIGVVLVGDENEGYTYAHIAGIKEAMSALNIADSQVVWYYSIPESE